MAFYYFLVTTILGSTGLYGGELDLFVLLQTAMQITQRVVVASSPRLNSCLVLVCPKSDGAGIGEVA